MVAASDLRLTCSWKNNYSRVIPLSRSYLTDANNYVSMPGDDKDLLTHFRSVVYQRFRREISPNNVRGKFLLFGRTSN